MQTDTLPAETGKRDDGWKNVITGLSTAADKTKKNRSVPNGIIPDPELESIYIDDGLGARIVNMLPDDMFREGWKYKFPDEEETSIEEYADIYDEVLEELKVDSKVREAFYWARLYGGAVILIGALDGQGLDAPLKPQRIRTFEYLRVIDRSDIIYSNIVFQLDPEKPRYGMPEFYPIRFKNAAGVDETQNVHYSRIIEVHGNLIPAGASHYSEEQRFWGISVLQNVNEHLGTVGTSIKNVGHLLHEFSTGKFKFAGLAEMLSFPDGEEKVRKRVEILDLMRSVFHSIYLDSSDDFIRDSVSFAGVPEVLYNLYMLVSAGTGYPITRLFGVSPAGMNATGESDMRNYYDMVRSKQTNEAEPILLRLVRIISEWKGIPEPYIEWNPLEQLSRKELAEVEKLEADKEAVIATTYQAYINAGIMEPYEARALQFGDTLDKIPPPEDLLPPVPQVSEEPPEDGGKENGEGGDDAKGGEDETAPKESDEDQPDKGDDEGAKASGDPDKPDDGKPDEGAGGDNAKKPDDMKAPENADDLKRLEELEAIEEPTDEEKAELEELRKKLKPPDDDAPADDEIKDRIAELEEKKPEDLTEEEQKELDALKKQLEKGAGKGDSAMPPFQT
jgi:phage-related protein (TIGR01555 family)